MSVRALTWAFEQPISATDKVVLLALADHANDHGECWPSISLLMQRAYVGERTVQRSLQSLEESGFIVRERRRRENGSDTSNLYRLMFTKVSHGVSAEISVDQRSLGGVNLAPHPKKKGVTQTGGEGVTQTGGGGGLHDTPRTVIKNHQEEPPSISADIEFAEFWAAYPKRPNNPKAPAMAKYVNARQRLQVSHETLVNAAKAYAATRKGEDPKYTAQAVTWLNQRRWEEDYTPVADQSDMDDVDLTELVKLYPGHVGLYPEVQAAVKAQLRTGATLDQICEAAKKYVQYLKELRYDGREVAAPMIETWLKFKWREMDAYEFARVGPDWRLTVRPKRKVQA